MEQKLYLLTGTAGFLGNNICAQLLERGNRVHAFVLSGDLAAKLIPEGVEQFDGNLCSKDDCMQFFDVEPGTQTVCIHCASMVTVNPSYSEKLMAVNVDGTDNILAAMKAHPECEKLVYVSSTGAISELPKEKRISEVSHFYPYDDALVVGWNSRTKAIATQHVLDAAKAGMNTCVVHPSGILGPNDNAVGETTKTVIKIIKGEMPVGMQSSFNLYDVRDRAAGCIVAADKGRKGEHYILANEEVTLKEMCTMLDQELHCGTCKVYLPLGTAKKIAAALEWKAAHGGKSPMITTFSVYNLERNNSFDYSKAQRELGYHTHPYSETLHDEAVWLKETGKLA